MSTVEAQITIDAPIEEVWKTIMDPRRLGDWVTIHRSVRDFSEPPLRRGATMEQTMAIRGLSFRVHWRLVMLSEPHEARWEGSGPAHSDAFIQYALTSEGPELTTFRYSNDFYPPGGRLGSMASRLIVGPTSEREAGASLARLKRLLEADRRDP